MCRSPDLPWNRLAELPRELRLFSRWTGAKDAPHT